MLFPPSTRAPPLSSIYALPFTHRTALLAPAYCNGVTRSEVISLCQLCLGLDLEDPTILVTSQTALHTVMGARLRRDLPPPLRVMREGKERTGA